MLTARNFPGIFKQLLRVVPAEYFDSANRNTRAYSFTFNECEKKGKLKIWNLLNTKGNQVNVVTDWYFHHTLWFFENPLDHHPTSRFTAHVEIMEEYREQVYVTDVPICTLCVDLDSQGSIIDFVNLPQGENARLFA